MKLTMAELIGILGDDNKDVRNTGFKLVSKLTEHSWSSAIPSHCDG
jgi:hypothetical protein